MLRTITIDNFALVDKAKIDFDLGLNVITGETGAGKSIVVDALSLLTGARATNLNIRTGQDYAYIEGIFELHQDSKVHMLLDELGIRITNELIVSRELSRSRSVVRLNGRAVPLRTLQAIGPQLIDLHGQSEQLSLEASDRQLLLLDSFGDLLELRNRMAESTRALRSCTDKLLSITKNEQGLLRELDLLKFQLNEINEANIVVGEEDQLFSERQVLTNSQQLASLAHETLSYLSAEDPTSPGAADLAGQASNLLARMHSYDPKLGDMAQELEQALEALLAIAGEVQNYSEKTEADPHRLTEVQERIEVISDLKRKYGSNESEILQFAAEAATQIDNIGNVEKNTSVLEAQLGELRATCVSTAQALSDARAVAASSLEQVVSQHLHDLGMPNVQFHISLTTRDNEHGLPIDENSSHVEINLNGIDFVSFEISPNLGEPLKPLAQIASGGETSRIMLALKAALNDKDKTPTLIFDEIDSGIGARSALAVGQKLGTLADSHQVLCVTHLAPIAAFADKHFFVHKYETKDRTITELRLLDRDQSLHELAEMGGKGDELSAAKKLKRHAATLRKATSTLT